jgi:acyl-CoA dehydrogenase family protein 9
MAVTDAQRERQIKQAEELFFSGPRHLGFAKALFFGRFNSGWVMPYPRLSDDELPRVAKALVEVGRFVVDELDPAEIDRQANIPRDIIRRLGSLGVLGMTVPEAYGGRGFSLSAYCRVMELIGSRCASTSVFINAHHSIGLRALLLFGTEEQKRRWLPALVSGDQLAAFALTEPEAGSDAANVQTIAVPSPDGSHYVLNGAKRYITNGVIASVLTVMARTPVPGSDETAITAFLVTPDMPGFRVIEPRMEKFSIRGTATSRLAFKDMAVPAGNVLGQLGKGLKVALTVLDFGRTTFGACCTGAAKSCLEMTLRHAGTRRQFDRTLGEFEMVKAKLASMSAHVYAMESMTTVTASLIDRGLEDYMVETAMLKVFTSEALWRIVDDAVQIHGGAAFFTDLPLERMLRDARINLVGEGASDVLKSFIALVGMKGPGEELRDLRDTLKRPAAALGTLLRSGRERMASVLFRPAVPVVSETLRKEAYTLESLIRSLHRAVLGALIRHREAILERQYVQERIAEAAMEVFASACVISRLDAELQQAESQRSEFSAQRAAAMFFLKSSARRIRRHLADLRENDDDSRTAAADAALGQRGVPTSIPY